MSMEEMKGMIKLPTPQRQQRSAPRQSRTTMSLQRRFVLMLLMRPDLATAADLNWAQISNDEDVLVKVALEAAIAYPQSKPAAILHHMQGKVNAGVMRDIERELHLLDESLDFSLEFEGARKQLKETYQKRDADALLSRLQEKLPSQLTDEEKALLRLGGRR